MRPKWASRVGAGWIKQLGTEKHTHPSEAFRHQSFLLRLSEKNSACGQQAGAELAKGRWALILANLLSSSHNYRYNWPQGNDSLIVIPLIHVLHRRVCCHFGDNDMRRSCFATTFRNVKIYAATMSMKSIQPLRSCRVLLPHSNDVTCLMCTDH